MNIKDYKKAIIDHFPLNGWKHKAGVQGGYFIIETPDIRYDFSYGYTNLIDEFNTGWAAGIAFKKLEEIYISAKNIDTKGKATLYLLDTSPEYYNGNRSFEYIIKDKADIIDMYQKIDSFLNKTAIAFYERFKTIDDIDKWFNTNPGQPIEYSSPLIRFNSQKGIIAAKLNGNTKYEKLIDKYRELQKGDYFASEFEQVVEYLKTYS